MNANMKNGRILLGAVVLLLLIALMDSVGSYNQLVRLDQAVQSQWGNVENAYQRRADLIPNLTATVKGAAGFEKSTYTAVAEARARVGQVGATGNAPNDPAAFAKYEQAQNNLTSALSHLIAVVENYPQLRATQNFSDLQVQLEGTENRIAVERMRYNDAAQTFNTTRNSFPTVLFAGFFGNRFAEKTYFKSRPASDIPPPVNL